VPSSWSGNSFCAPCALLDGKQKKHMSELRHKILSTVSGFGLGYEVSYQGLWFHT
jgi:hypothetical protein